jgi:dTDP-4-dehydrorhamnose reductase
VIADQFGAPTTASLIADVTAQIVARHWLFGERSAFPAGIYHLAAAGETTWHGYATEVLTCRTEGRGAQGEPRQHRANSGHGLSVAGSAATKLATGYAQASRNFWHSPPGVAAGRSFPA